MRHLDSRDRKRRTKSGLRLVVPMLAMIGVAAAAGCVDTRERPGPTAPGSSGGGGGTSRSANLSVELLAPDGQENYFIMGRNMEIRVRGTEGSRQLQGLGYEVRRSGFLRTIHEDLATFSSATSAEQAFSYVPPDTLPNPTLLLIRGYAVGANQERKYTDFQEVQVLFCPEDAVWC